MTAPTRTDLNRIVDEEAASALDPSPGPVAKEVRARLEREGADPWDVVEQMLPGFVQHRLTRGRASLPDVTDLIPADPPVVVPAQRKQGRSWKRDGIRRWAAQLGKTYAIADNNHMRLGQMTADDLAAAAKIREDMAAANAESARRLRALHDLIVSYRASTVSDLPDTVLAKVFGDDR